MAQPAIGLRYSDLPFSSVIQSREHSAPECPRARLDIGASYMPRALPVWTDIERRYVNCLQTVHTSVVAHARSELGSWSSA